MKPLLKTSLLIIAMAMVGSISGNTGGMADYGDLNSTLFDQPLKLAELVLNDPVVIQPPGA